LESLFTITGYLLDAVVL